MFPILAPTWAIWHYWDRRNWITLRRTPVDGIERLWQTVFMTVSESLTGRRETRRDTMTAAPLARLAAVLDHPGLPWPNGEVPPLGHWLFTLPDARQSLLGPDGHPVSGGLIAPPPAPRRMWGGSRLSFPGVLKVGDDVERRSTVAGVKTKGAMTFVTVRHEISARGAVAVIEDQDLVYLPERQRGHADAPPAAVDVPEALSLRTLAADAALLFRFSALTFNAHRIHYDRDYACGVERYPGLVVHGPLLAMLLVDHALRGQPEARVTAFSFRARAPVFDGEAFDLCRNGGDLWVRCRDGVVAMTAQIGFA